jgi:hypothetical protein
METILSIAESAVIGGGDAYGDKEGFVITTDQQVIVIAISSYQSCCESYGYLSSEDDFSAYVGAELLGIEQVDTALRAHSELESLDEGGAMFVNLLTDRGTLQFVVYNGHNGYYGHTGVVISHQLSVSESL